jgi:hypothetical protein
MGLHCRRRYRCFVGPLGREKSAYVLPEAKDGSEPPPFAIKKLLLPLIAANAKGVKTRVTIS